MAVRNYSAQAKTTELVNLVTTAQVSFLVQSLSTFPDSTPYIIVLDDGSPLDREEVVLVVAHNKSTNTVTDSVRGYDGTIAKEHSAGASVKHAVSAIDFREANTFINAPKTWGQLKNGG